MKSQYHTQMTILFGGLIALSLGCSPGGGGSSPGGGGGGDAGGSVELTLNRQSNNAEADMISANLVVAKFTGSGGATVSGLAPTLASDSAVVINCTPSDNAGNGACFLRSSTPGTYNVTVDSLPTGTTVSNMSAMDVTFVSPLPKPAYQTTSSHGIGISVGSSEQIVSLIGEAFTPIRLFDPGAPSDRVITSGLIGTVVE